MERNCHYEEVNTQTDDELGTVNVVEDRKLPWNLFMRQVLIVILSAVWANIFTLGLCLGSPTVIIPQIRREANSTAIISDQMASWLSSSYSYSGMLQIVVLTALPRYIGPKKCFLLVSIIALCGFILMYLCKTVTQLLISAIMHGTLFASMIVITVMTITEYSSPRYRGMFLTFKSASFLWGVWVANGIGTFFHWKYIALLGCALTVYILIAIILLWPESPLWLASKGRFDECANTHYWLKGNSVVSKRELEELVNFHKNCQKLNVDGNKKTFFKNLFDMIFKKGYYKLLLLAMLVECLYSSLGKLTCTIYAFDILKKITNSESAAYNGMLILDGVAIIGAYVGSGVSNFVQRRSFILLTSAVGIVFLYLLSLFMYLVNFNIIADNMYISLFLLSVYSLAVTSGPIIMSASLVSEFIPVTNRYSFALIIAIFGNFVFATFIKMAPYLFSTWGFSGSFLFYAISSSIFAILLHKFLPETKDKTLLEIENLLTGRK